jgi:hypothetical protein
MWDFETCIRILFEHMFVRERLEASDDGPGLIRLDSWLRETSMALYFWYQDSLVEANRVYEECRDNE